MKNISKHDLNEVLVENGVMSALADWLSPLPDRSLPSLDLRTKLLKKLHLFTTISSETLKHSGTVFSHYILCIGQRVLKYIKMRLYKLNE